MEKKPAAPAHSFNDVRASGAVSWMVDRAITTGTSASTFSPDNPLTRAQLAAFLWRLEGKPEAPAHSFGDVHAGWQQVPVSWMLDRAITTGTSASTFSPDLPLTRAHLVTFLYRYKNEPAVTIDPDTSPCGPLKTIAAGHVHSCGLRTDNTVICCGDNLSGQTDAPSGTFETIALGQHHSCGIQADNAEELNGGRITCWGLTGLDDVPSGTFKTVTAGNGHSCGIRSDNTVTCWGTSIFSEHGTDEYGRTDVPPGTFKTVTAGNRHSCGIRSDNTVICWGANDFGQTDAPSGTFKTVTAGWEHSCGIRTDNTATCWGAIGLWTDLLY